MKRVLTPVFSLAICFFVIWKWTLGFSAFTVFSYTLSKAGNIPRILPDIPMIDQNGKIFHLKEKHKYVLVNFVYLNCPYVCHKVNNQLEQIYYLIDTSIIPSKLEFVTVSFDLKNDDIGKIKKYRSYFGANIPGWIFTLPYQSSQDQFDQFLHQAGIWKYEAPSTGIINHSIYLFLISPENKIVKIFDPVRENNDVIVQQIYSCLKGHNI